MPLVNLSKNSSESKGLLYPINTPIGKTGKFLILFNLTKVVHNWARELLNNGSPSILT